MEGTNEELGVIKVDGHIAKVTYVGGSVFGINFVDMKDAKPMQARRNVVDKWIKQGSMRLTNATLYNQIIKDIDPETGETPTHHADGTTKTLVERELSELKAKGLIDKNADATKLRELKEEQDKAKAGSPMSMPRQRTAEPQKSEQDKQTSVQDTKSKPSPSHATSGTSDTTQMPVSNIHPVTPLDESSQFDDSATTKKTRSRVIIFVIVMLVIALLGLAIAYSVTSGRKGGFNLASLREEQQMSTDTNTNQKDTDESRTDTGNAKVQVVSDGNTITRTDYDPETGVEDMATADDDTRDLASQMMTYIRQCFTDGSVDDFRSAVNIDNIADQIAASYARQVKESKASMTDASAQELKDYYKQALIEDEEQHVTDHDPYGSIFGGRIRDVRVSADEEHTIYIVTESLGGDHQRVCLVMRGNDDGTSWVVDSIVDPDDYVTQIMKGDTSQYVKENE